MTTTAEATEVLGVTVTYFKVTDNYIEFWDNRDFVDGMTIKQYQKLKANYEKR